MMIFLTIELSLKFLIIDLKKLVLEFDTRRTKATFARIDELAVHTTFLQMSPKIFLIFRGGFMVRINKVSKYASG